MRGENPRSAREILNYYLERLEDEIERMRELLLEFQGMETIKPENPEVLTVEPTQVNEAEILRLREDRERLEAILKAKVVQVGDVEFIPRGGHLTRIGGVILLSYPNIDDCWAACQILCKPEVHQGCGE